MTVASKASSFLTSSRLLYRGVLQDDVIAPPLSAASLQATRLCSNADSTFTLATGTCVYRIECEPTRKRKHPSSSYSQSDDDADINNEKVEENYDENGNRNAVNVVKEAVADDFLVARERFSTLSIRRDALHSSHESEVQSVSSSSDGRIASVDSYGRCIITMGCTNSEKKPRVDGDHPLMSYTLCPGSRFDGAPGWAGIALQPGNSHCVAVARQLFHDVTVYDNEMVTRRIHTTQPPHAIHALSHHTSTIAVTEGYDVSLYDLRTPSSLLNKPSLTSRKQVSNYANHSAGALLALDANLDETVLVAAGMDRVVHTLDVRAGLAIRDRWSGCLKHECAGVVTSSRIDGLVYACSVDNEVACGATDSSVAQLVIDAQNGQGGESRKMMSGANARSIRRAFGFRADVRVTGMAKRVGDGSEDVAVVSESAGFYLLRCVS